MVPKVAKLEHVLRLDALPLEAGLRSISDDVADALPWLIPAQGAFTLPFPHHTSLGPNATARALRHTRKRSRPILMADTEHDVAPRRERPADVRVRQMRTGETVREDDEGRFPSGGGGGRRRGGRRRYVLERLCAWVYGRLRGEANRFSGEKRAAGAWEGKNVRVVVRRGCAGMGMRRAARKSRS